MDIFGLTLTPSAEGVPRKMGLFGSRKDGHREHIAAAQDTSPSLSQSAPKRSSSRIPRLGILFSDSVETSARDATAGNHVSNAHRLSAPTIDMDDIELSSTVVVKGAAPIPPHITGIEDDTRKLSAVTASPGLNNLNKSMGRQDAIMRRANSITRMAHRDSIKRSVSRIIARSESRQKGRNIECEDSNSENDHRIATPCLSQPSCDSEDEMEKTEVSSSSTGFSLLARSKESFQDDTTKLGKIIDFVSAYGEDDIFLVEEATRKDFEVNVRISNDTEQQETAESARGDVQAPVSSQVLSSLEERGCAKQTDAAGGSHAKLTKVRKRPPPLVSTDAEKSSADSTSDWPHTAMFGKDGGFATGGFRITADGMVGIPELVTREDSDAQLDGEVPQSDRNLVIARSLKEFRAGPTIGSGAAGRVYLAEHVPSKRTMAMKVVNVYDKEKRNQLLKELETLCTYTSRYLVRFYGAFYDGSGAVHIALEYMDHGCLSTFVQRVGSIPENVVQMIAVDCLRGLRFLHRNHVLHRDFKTANILLSRRLCCAKLSDFGLARDLDEGVSKIETFVGTVAYMSPERLQGSQYTYASDIWAVGVSMVECLLGRYPFDKPQNYFDYIEAAMTADMWKSMESSGRKISSEAQDFVIQCTQTDPSQRPGADQLLEHPWIIGVKKDSNLFGSWLDHCRIISMRVQKHTEAINGR